MNVPRAITLSAFTAGSFQVPAASCGPAQRLDLARGNSPDAPFCTYCGAEVGLSQLQDDGSVACPLCDLPLHLERPQIDQEAALIWLPEMSQLAVNSVMRAIHMRLRALREDVQIGAPFKSADAGVRQLSAAL